MPMYLARFSTHLDVQEAEKEEDKESDWDEDIEVGRDYRTRVPLRKPGQLPTGPVKYVMSQESQYKNHNTVGAKF